jgi:carboxymethylenebutenolidase
MSELIIPSKDGQSFTAYVAMPAKLPAPAVIVIQEIFGVNAEIRKKCDDLAAQGFIGVAPDLFWRLEPNVQLTDKSEAEWAKAFDLFNRFDVDSGIEDLRATHHVFRGHAHSTGVVGCVGYCLGGKLAYLMAARSRVDAAVSFYGVGLDALLYEAVNIKKPLLMHIAENDKFVPPEAQAQIKEALQNKAAVTIHSYPGCDHAFARGGGEHHDENAARIANERTLEFLTRTLNLVKAA